ncbi:MAG: radical SAM protein [Planctomycetes bacterium]|nr:radical SAM protein [Planctomycetota bacterium]
MAKRRSASRPAPPSLPADQLAVWEFAGLMITYWCNARCAFCYVYSAPDRGGAMSAADAVQMWRGLDELAASAGKTMRIHLAGGEPFGDWVQLLSIVRAARDAGLTRLEKVETNAFWATSDGLTRARLEQLNALGIDLLLISADVFHQEFVPMERVVRCVEIARAVLGPSRVRVRWWDFYNQPVDVRKSDDDAKRRAYAVALARHRERLTGRASDRLAEFYERFPAEHFRDANCVREVLHGRHVHIDPYGNVFPGVCSGIIIGNALRTPIPQLWKELAERWREHPIIGRVVSGGSFELYQAAAALGFAPRPEGYSGKCQLCQDVRQFLLEHGGWEQWVGPPDAYANEKDKQEADRWKRRVDLTVEGAPR